jgi:hypothetical protein
MSLFDTLLAARDGVEAWLVDNPTKNAQHSSVFAAEEQLSQALVSLEGMDEAEVLAKLQTDTKALTDAAGRLAAIAGGLDEVQSIVKDVGIVVSILGKLVAA